MEKSVHVFMLILVLHVLESAFANQFYSLSLADECSMLFQFKENMSINSSASSYSCAYPKVSSWNLNRSDGVRNCCLWDGVTCSLGHVVRLDLRSSFLSGPISSNNSLFNLTHLHRLILADNDFRFSQIPASIGNLKYLTILDLSNCAFAGTLPVSVSNLTHLKFLDLSGNKFTGSLPSLERFPNLTYLSLSRCMWNISKEAPIERSLSQNLLMSFKQHSPVTSWVRLETPDPSHNMLTGEIAPSICHLLHLQFLDLSFNNFTGAIPPCLEKLINSFVMLNLRSNTLQGISPNIFTNGSKLKMIDLSENKLEGRLPRSLENCESLQILDLGDNFIEDMFPFWLGALSELQVLILRLNKFHGTIRIPSKIKVNLSKLHIIDLSYNSFSGDLPHQYFREWSAMKETKANATYINFPIKMTNKGMKMEYVRIINTFSAIDLSSNMFRGEIPELIKTLSGLQLLNLSNNELSGVIPPSMGNLIRLESLDLSSNKLSGIIPQDLVQLNFLEVLNVSNNSLTGSIPQGKQFNTFLNDSYMGNQALCGYPLSMNCGDSKASRSPKVSIEEATESFPNGVDWVIILIGVVSGLVIGLVCEDYLTTRYYIFYCQR